MIVQYYTDETNVAGFTPDMVWWHFDRSLYILIVGGITISTDPQTCFWWLLQQYKFSKGAIKSIDNNSQNHQHSSQLQPYYETSAEPTMSKNMQYGMPSVTEKDISQECQWFPICFPSLGSNHAGLPWNCQDPTSHCIAGISTIDQSPGNHLHLCSP